MIDMYRQKVEIEMAEECEQQNITLQARMQDTRLQDTIIRGVSQLNAFCAQYPQTWRAALQSRG